jgi:pyridoxal phosphate enzyme (YggS family)
MIPDNLNEVRKRIAEACGRCGRNREDVLLVAVSKTFGVQAVREAFESGQQDFGENYVQELQAKRETLADPGIRWHFIGHLQSNKVKFIVPYVCLIHSVDNDHLALEIQKQAENRNQIVDVLIEVHTTDEATKYGIPPPQVMALAKRISGLRNVRLQGLMTMGPFSDDPNDSRPSFRQIVDLKKDIEREGIERATLRQLSMGMTHDFEVAIEEGATIVRIGTAIFGNRIKPDSSQTEGMP